MLSWAKPISLMSSGISDSSTPEACEEIKISQEIFTKLDYFSFNKYMCMLLWRKNLDGRFVIFLLCFKMCWCGFSSSKVYHKARRLNYYSWKIWEEKILLVGWMKYCYCNNVVDNITNMGKRLHSPAWMLHFYGLEAHRLSSANLQQLKEKLSFSTKKWIQ